MKTFDSMSREYFLMQRNNGYQAALADWNERGSPPNEFIMPPPDDDEIICDLCNADVQDNIVTLYGTYLLCQTCRTTVEKEKENGK